TGSGDVLDAHEPVVVDRRVFERRPDDAKRRILAEPVEQEGKVAIVERDVRVEASDDVVVDVAQARVAGIEGLDLARELTFRPREGLWGPGQPPIETTPRRSGGVPRSAPVRLVGRAVADDDPSLRADRLPDNGRDGQLDRARLVACGRDEDVPHQLRATPPQA